MTINRDDVIRMATEAGMNLTPAQFSGVLENEVTEVQLERFATLVAAKERAARQAAQVEVAELKGRIARAGIERCRAVLEEREACAQIVELNAAACDKAHYPVLRDVLMSNAAAIRARGGVSMTPPATHFG